LSKQQVKWLVPVGGAAALAAAFNTPIAAVLFALEEIMGDLHAPVLGSVVLSSATSWMVLHLVLGDEPLFHVPAYRLVNPGELAVYVVLGIVGGLCSVVFVKLLLRLRAWFAKLPPSTLWFQPVVGGLTVGVIGYFVPQVLGVGYDTVGNVLNGELVLKMVILLAALKIIATAVCYASGNAGGIFGPSMFIGAMVGGSVGTIAHMILPNATGGPGPYALVGMGTAFAGIIRTPLTSVIMIFEVTRDYSIIVPLMISNLIAFFISQKLQKEPIYEALARQDGLHLPLAPFRARGGGPSVNSAIRESPAPIASALPVNEAALFLEGSSLESWPVTDDAGLVGMVRVRDVLERRQDNAHTIADVMTLAQASEGDHEIDFPHVHNDQSLEQALARMGEWGHNVLPVVSRANARIILGVVTLQDVLKAYGLANEIRAPAARKSTDG
jgi:CIC family chloride channel protein